MVRKRKNGNKNSNFILKDDPKVHYLRADIIQGDSKINVLHIVKSGVICRVRLGFLVMLHKLWLLGFPIKKSSRISHDTVPATQSLLFCQSIYLENFRLCMTYVTIIMWRHPILLHPRQIWILRPRI